MPGLWAGLFSHSYYVFANNSTNPRLIFETSMEEKQDTYQYFIQNCDFWDNKAGP